MQTKIKFVASGANSAIGGFSPGDIARLDTTLAAHLVDVARVAVYVDAHEAAQPVAKTEQKAKKAAKK